MRGIQGCGGVTRDGMRSRASQHTAVLYMLIRAILTRGKVLFVYWKRLYHESRILRRELQYIGAAVNKALRRHSVRPGEAKVTSCTNKLALPILSGLSACPVQGLGLDPPRVKKGVFPNCCRLPNKTSAVRHH